VCGIVCVRMYVYLCVLVCVLVFVLASVCVFCGWCDCVY